MLPAKVYTIPEVDLRHLPKQRLGQIIAKMCWVSKNEIINVNFTSSSLIVYN